MAEIINKPLIQKISNISIKEESDLESYFRDTIKLLLAIREDVDTVRFPKVKLNGFIHSKVSTDGVLMITMNDGSKLRYINETKYSKTYNRLNVRFDELLARQLAQCFAYDYLSSSNYDGFILNSDKYFCYIYKKDIAIIRPLLRTYFKEYKGNPSSFSRKVLTDTERSIVKIILKNNVLYKGSIIDDSFNIEQEINILINETKNQ